MAMEKGEQLEEDVVVKEEEVKEEAEQIKMMSGRAIETRLRRL